MSTSPKIVNVYGLAVFSENMHLNNQRKRENKASTMPNSLGRKHKVAQASPEPSPRGTPRPLREVAAQAMPDADTC